MPPATAFFFAFMMLLSLIYLNVLITIVTYYFWNVRNIVGNQDDQSAIAALLLSKVDSYE